MTSILFVCTGNTCRSPLAERLARLKFPQHRWESAGVRPEGGMHPLSAHVLSELGGNTDNFNSRFVSDLNLSAYGHVVLIGDTAQQLCPPIPPGVQRHDWDVPDPYDAEGSDDEKLAVYRETAEKLLTRIEALVDQIESVQPKS